MLSKLDRKVLPIVRELACGILLTRARLQPDDVIKFDYRGAYCEWTLEELENEAVCDSLLADNLLAEPLWIAWLAQCEADQAVIASLSTYPTTNRTSRPVLPVSVPPLPSRAKSLTATSRPMVQHAR